MSYSAKRTESQNRTVPAFLVMMTEPPLENAPLSGRVSHGSRPIIDGV